MRHHTLGLAAAVVASTLALGSALPAGAVTAGSGAATPTGSTGDALTTKTPYAPQQSATSYERPPAGYTPVFTENVSRHGTRTMSDSEDGDLVLALADRAAQQGALTPLGKSLAGDVRAQLAANESYGYGLLTPIGRAEMRDTAGRLVHRLPGLFAAAARDHQPIDVVSAGQQRVLDSADEFVDGLEAAAPSVAPEVGATRTDDALLYFHKTDPAYNDYLDNDPRIGAAEDAVTDSARTHRTAREVLLRSFTPAFVDRVAAGAFPDVATDEVEAAEAFYALAQNAADVPGDWHMSRYITADQTAWFGYLDDVESFYENGPGFAGTDATYAMARGLLDDMLSALEAKRAGTSDAAAELRFTHAEEVFPLSALLGLPGSDEQQPEGTEFTYADNDFRGARVAPMGANIQWDLYRSGSHYLVRMLVNEKQTAFKSACTPVRPGSYFYSLDELESCYAY